MHHPKTVQYTTHSDPKMISPVWTKVGATPWKGRSELTGGYGRTLLNSSISDDAPTYFLNPERTANRQVLNHSQQLKIIPRHESSHVLPGGRSLIKFKERHEEGMYRTRHRKFPHGNETVIDALPSGRTEAARRSPIQWGALPPAGPKEYFKED